MIISYLKVSPERGSGVNPMTFGLSDTGSGFHYLKENNAFFQYKANPYANWFLMYDSAWTVDGTVSSVGVTVESFKQHARTLVSNYGYWKLEKSPEFEANPAYDLVLFKPNKTTEMMRMNSLFQGSLEYLSKRNNYKDFTTGKMMNTEDDMILPLGSDERKRELFNAFNYDGMRGTGQIKFSAVRPGSPYYGPIKWHFCPFYPMPMLTNGNPTGDGSLIPSTPTKILNLKIPKRSIRSGTTQYYSYFSLGGFSKMEIRTGQNKGTLLVEFFLEYGRKPVYTNSKGVKTNKEQILNSYSGKITNILFETLAESVVIGVSYTSADATDGEFQLDLLESLNRGAGPLRENT